MNLSPLRAAVSSASLTAAVFATALCTGASAQNVLTRHLHSAVSTGTVQPTGHLDKSQPMNLDIVLPLGDPDGLQTFLQDLYDPSSSSFHKYLTPAQFTAKFGPSQAAYSAVLKFASSKGLTVTGGSRDGMDVQVQGTVAQVERAFHVNLLTYNHPTENRTFYSPDREPSTDLNFALWHVSGLENYSVPHPLYVSRTALAQARGVDPQSLVSRATTGSGPSASYLGSDMRAAYYGGSLTGSGQNLGLFEYEGTDLADLSNYYKTTGQTQPLTPVLLSVDGTSTACVDQSSGSGHHKVAGCDDTEQTLDMTQALGMAPGLSSLTVYIGSTDTAIISAMTTHNPLPSTIGCSWGWTPADPNTLDPYFQKMSAQGQTFFAASGDSSTWSSRNEAWPADDVNVTAVGGTDLVTASAGGAWKSETAWVDSGGGVSPDRIGIPSWQAGAINSTNKGSTVYRNGPDVAANANFTFYVCADQTTCTANEYGGTSFAAPMWAAYTALVNQQRNAQGSGNIGFLNKTLYAENSNTTTYSTDFHDIISGTSGSYSAVVGYDLVTGWGSPTPNLLTTLAAQ